MKKYIITVAVLICSAFAAEAQTTYVAPALNGGYTVSTPGQPTTYVAPALNGGYMISTPGRPTTYVAPALNGGYQVTTPGGYRPNTMPRRY